MASFSPMPTVAAPAGQPVVCAPLAQPVAPVAAPAATVAPAYQYTYVQSYGMPQWGQFLLWFIILAIIAFIILWLVNPTGLQKRGLDGFPTGQQDPGRILVAAIVIALIIVLILWLLKAARC